MSKHSGQPQPHFQLLPSLVKGAGVTFVGRAGSIALNAVFGLLVARQYGIQISGIFFLAYSIILFLQLFITMGLQHAAVRYVSMYFNKDNENFRKYLQNIFFLNLLFSISVSVIAYAVAPTIGNVLGKPDVGILLRGLTVFLFLSSITEAMAASTRGTGKMTYNSTIFLIEVISRTAFFVIFFLLSKANPVQVLWLSFSFGGGMSFIASLVFVYINYGNIFRGFSVNIETIRDLLRFSIPQGFADLVNNLYQIAPLYLLGYFAASEDVGLMGAATRVTSLGTIFLFAFNTVFAPYISKLYHTNELNKLKETYKTLAYWIFGSSLVFFMFLLIYPVEFMGLFGDDFMAGGNVLIILTIGQIVNCFTGSVGLMLTMSGRTKVTLMNSTLALIAVSGLGFLLIPNFGVVGAAISYSLSIALVNLLRSYEVYKIFGFHSFSIRMAKALYAAALSGLFLIFIKFIIGNQSYSGFAVSMIIALIIYLLSFLIIGLTKEDFVVIEATRKSLSRNVSN